MFCNPVLVCCCSSIPLLGRWSLTCRLPLGQYSVTMQMLGGSMQAPINLVRWLNWTSLIWNIKYKNKSSFSVLIKESLQRQLCLASFVIDLKEICFLSIRWYILVSDEVASQNTPSNSCCSGPLWHISEPIVAPPVKWFVPPCSRIHQTTPLDQIPLRPRLSRNRMTGGGG